MVATVAKEDQAKALELLCLQPYKERGLLHWLIVNDLFFLLLLIHEEYLIILILLVFCSGVNAQVTVKVHEMNNMDERDGQIKEAVELFEWAINSDEFKTKLLSQKKLKGNHITMYVSENSKIKIKKVKFDNLSVYNYIMKAEEPFLDGERAELAKTGVIDLWLSKGDSTWTSEYSATGSVDGSIRFSPIFLGDEPCSVEDKNMCVATIASVIAHEYMHVLGFRHLRKGIHHPNDIPETVDRIVKELIREKLGLD